MSEAQIDPEDLEPFEAHSVLEAVRVGDRAQVDAALALDPEGIHERSHAYAWDPLGLALTLGKLDLATHLLDRGADPNSWDENDATPLTAATGLAEPLALEAVQLLADRGATVRACDLSAAALGGSLLVFDRLRALPQAEDDADGDDPPSELSLHATLLERAARRGDLATTDAVLERAPQLASDPSLLARGFEGAAEAGQLEAWERLSRHPMPDLRRVVPALVRGYQGYDRAPREAVLTLIDKLLASEKGAADRLWIDGAGVPELEQRARNAGADTSVKQRPDPRVPSEPAPRPATSDRYFVIWGIVGGLAIIFAIVGVIAALEALGLI